MKKSFKEMLSVVRSMIKYKTYIIVFCSLVIAQPVYSQPECATAEFIEEMNQGALERVAHIRGKNAILFIALDPAWSAPEFDYEHRYRDEHYIAAMKRMRETLQQVGIDEIIIWRLGRPETMGTAIPFKAGCAVQGYGEPDSLDKLMNMHKSYVLISQHGLDHSSVKESIGKIVGIGSYADVRIVIENLRTLMKRINIE